MFSSHKLCNELHKSTNLSTVKYIKEAALEILKMKYSNPQGVSFFFFFSLRIFLLEQKLHMAWQQNLANTMASPRNLQHNTTKEIKIVNTKHTYI